ncbi:MAG TPA: winged helix DNA-binding domain-containing protein [Pseudonocardia sp.]
MTGPVLTWPQLNRAVLGRQLLLQRAELTAVEAVERLGGLQTQYSPSAYVGLWSRLTGFRRAELTDALLNAQVVQAWVMRCTIHMVAARDYRPLNEAVRIPRRRWWLRSRRGVTEAEMAAAAAATGRRLADGPRKQADLVAGLVADGFAAGVFPGVQLWLDLVRVPPAGTWNSPRAHVYGLAEQWVPPQPPTDLAAAEELLVTRYLTGFGPATPSDVSRYAGWTVTETKAVLRRLELCTLHDPDGAQLVDLPGAPRPEGDTPAPVRFLSTFDALLLLGHAKRARIVPADHREKVFSSSMPQSIPTFLVAGQVAGTWRYVDDHVTPTPFTPLPRATRREVEAEAERLTAFYREG